MVWFTKLPPQPTGTYRARTYGIAVKDGLDRGPRRLRGPR